jgi:antitoxin HicB
MIIAYPYLADLDDDGRYFVHFIDIEEAITQADSLEEAAFNAAEVLSGILACRLDDNDEIPEPSVCPENGFMAYPETKIQATLLLRKARGNKSLTELANAMNTTWSAVEKLEDYHHTPNLNQMDKAAKALGKRLVLSLE